MISCIILLSFLIERMITLTIIQMNLANGLLASLNYDIIAGDKKLVIFSIPHEQHFLTAFKIFQDNLFWCWPKNV